MKPAVSIIIPTYNRGYILPVAIQSVLTQTNGSWELLVVDDGSTDDTEKAIETFQDSRIRYFKQENRGQAVARNAGLEKAKGDWIAFLDSDNELLPDFIDEALKAFE